MKKIKLKGGSLAETCLIIPENGPSFVRKSVSLTKKPSLWFSKVVFSTKEDAEI